MEKADVEVATLEAKMLLSKLKKNEKLIEQARGRVKGFGFWSQSAIAMVLFALAYWDASKELRMPLLCLFMATTFYIGANEYRLTSRINAILEILSNIEKGEEKKPTKDNKLPGS